MEWPKPLVVPLVYLRSEMSLSCWRAFLCLALLGAFASLCCSSSRPAVCVCDVFEGSATGCYLRSLVGSRNDIRGIIGRAYAVMLEQAFHHVVVCWDVPITPPLNAFVYNWSFVCVFVCLCACVCVTQLTSLNAIIVEKKEILIYFGSHLLFSKRAVSSGSEYLKYTIK